MVSQFEVQVTRINLSQLGVAIFEPLLRIKSDIFPNALIAIDLYKKIDVGAIFAI